MPASDPEKNRFPRWERPTIPYDPRLAQVLGSVNAALLLQQVLYWWFLSGRQPFYKFKEPCSHFLYRPGDSWAEELGLSRRQLDQARARIAVRVSGPGEAGGAGRPDRPVRYWVAAGHISFYTVNPAALAALLEQAHGELAGQFLAALGLARPGRAGQGTPARETPHTGRCRRSVSPAAPPKGSGPQPQTRAGANRKRDGPPALPAGGETEKSIPKKTQDPESAAAFAALITQLRCSLDRPSFEFLLGDARLESFDPQGVMVVSLGTPLAREWLEAQLCPVVGRAASEVLGPGASVVFRARTPEEQAGG